MLQMQMRSIVTDRVAWSVHRSVTTVSPAKTAPPIEMLFGLKTQVGPVNRVLDGVQIPHNKGQFWGKRLPIVKYWNFLPWAVQKQLNQLTCCLGGGLRWDEESTCSIVFARWRQCSHIGGHIGTTWRIQLNHPSAAAMQSYVKFLWPLVYLSNTFRQKVTPATAALYSINNKGH